MQHARRLYPGRITPKNVLEWGYYRVEPGSEEGAAEGSGDPGSGGDGGGAWVAVDPRSVLSGLQAAAAAATTAEDASPALKVERDVGFEGTADPSTGYYCTYDGGRRVGGASSAVGKPPSRRIA
jgi:hypothetical protein